MAKRQRRNRGSIVKRGDHSWAVVLDLGRDPTNGKRRRRWITVNGTKKDAEKRLTELNHQLDTGDFTQPTKLSFGTFIQRWLREYAWPNLSPETAQVYEIIATRHLMPAIGKVSIQQLTPERIQAYYADKLANGRRDGQGGLSPRTVRHHHRLLHVVLGSAVKWRILQRNPADLVDPPKYRQKEMQTFDQNGLGVFLESINGTEYYPLFYTLLFTGARRAEVLALRWQDIDLDFGQVSINRSLHHLNDRSFVFQQPKTEKSRRLVALPPSASIVLRRHRDNQRAQRLMTNRPVTESDLVFAHWDGTPLLPHSITQAWSRLAKKAGYAHIRLHDARHSHASLMLAQGVHPKIVSERLGHSSVSMTLDVYSHILPGLQEAAARAFGEGIR